MPELLLHPKTMTQIGRLIANQPNSILISGADGSGKETLAAQVAAGLLGIPAAKLNGYAYLQRINPKEDYIAIEEIRSLQQFLKLKVPSAESKLNRAVIIDRAERMRTETQNALLKTLEEPPADTAIILTAAHPEILLPTITSRTQELAILPVSETQATGYFKARGKKGSDIAKCYALSQGQAGLLYSLLENENHPLIAQVSLAKQILAENPGKRLLHTDELAKDKQQARLLLNALIRITHAALAAAAKQQRPGAVEQWRQRQAIVAESSEHLIYNPNMKLLLDNLFLSL